MSCRYSVYVLSPDRRFVEGTDSLEDAKSKAREIALTWKKDSREQKVESAEVWDNNTQSPCYGAERKWGGALEEIEA